MGNKYTTENFPVLELYYYVINFKRFMYPVLMPVRFPSKEAAKRVLKENIPNSNERKFYSVIKGKTIKHEHIPYIVGDSNYLIRGGKYYYNNTHKTTQDKKSFRTLMRRRIRRMGLLSNVKLKLRYDEKGNIIRYKENKQKVADNKNSAAKVFQLDRKPKKYYYIILKKCLSTERGKLFKIKCIQVNIKTGVFKKITIHTMRNDIFVPELITNLNKIENAQGAVRHYFDSCKR